LSNGLVLASNYFLILECSANPNASLYASGNPLSLAYNNRDEKMKGLLFCYGVELDPITAGLEGETSAVAVILQNDVTLAQDLLWVKVVVGIQILLACVSDT
tara:strand:- start:205 stop:510 length:306 start_codon:yes stop_codon:yes gene_type:complete